MQSPTQMMWIVIQCETTSNEWLWVSEVYTRVLLCFECDLPPPGSPARCFVSRVDILTGDETHMWKRLKWEALLPRRQVLHMIAEFCTFSGKMRCQQFSQVLSPATSLPHSWTLPLNGERKINIFSLTLLLVRYFVNAIRMENNF